jgi:hypothetical protein
MVPEEDVGKALYLLDPGDNVGVEEDSADEDEANSSISGIDKAVLGATAIALNPLGAGIGYAISKIMGSEEEKTAYEFVYCPHCGTGLDLSEDEVTQR